jgi:phosphatidylglycerol lysyltransferase
MKINWKLFRRVLIIGLAFVAFFETGALIKRMPTQLLTAILNEIPLGTLFGMIIVGLVAASLPILHDKVLADILQPDVKGTPWVTAWVNNAFNNGLGVLNFVSNWLFLRSIKKQSPTVKSSVRHFWWFDTTGVSTVSVILLMLVGFSGEHDLYRFFPLLIIGLALPLFGAWFSRKLFKEHLTASKSQYLKLYGTSLISELGRLGAFLGLGLLFHMPINFWLVIPAYYAARIFGMITLIPGSWGTFDIFLFFGLQHIGLEPAVAFLWILFYRLFFTLLPFLIATLVALIRGLFVLNENFRGAPGDILGSIVQKIVVGLFYFFGTTIILVGALPGTMTKLTFLDNLSPLANNFLLQVPNLIIGFLLIAAGRGLAYRVTKAWLPAVLLLLVTTVYVAIARTHWQPILIGLVTLGLTLSIRPKLYRDQFIYSIEGRVFDGVLLGVIFMTYIMVGVAHLPVIHDRFQINEHGVLLLPSVHWWLIGFGAIVLAALAMLGYLSYLTGRKQVLLGETLDEARYGAVLALGDNHYASLAFLGDKRIFYYRPANAEADTVAIQFRVFNNKANVMSDPVGSSADFGDALGQFIATADKLGYVPVFYEVSERIAMMAHEFGYNFMKLGEEARVSTPTFKTAGKKFANIRSEINQAEAAGFTYEVVEPPFSSDFLTELRRISDIWLNGREEKGYSLGYFKESYLQRDGIAVLKSEAGEIVAFATLVTSQTENQMAVDLMRFTKGAPNGTMDVLFVKTFDYARDTGYNTFNLGMSPLANVGSYNHSFIRERIANLIYQFGSSIYSFEGLRRYKHKFATSWQPYYISYSNRSNIIFVMLGLLMIDNPGVEND